MEKSENASATDVNAAQSAGNFEETKQINQEDLAKVEPTEIAAAEDEAKDPEIKEDVEVFLEAKPTAAANKKSLQTQPTLDVNFIADGGLAELERQKTSKVTGKSVS